MANFCPAAVLGHLISVILDMKFGTHIQGLPENRRVLITDDKGARAKYPFKSLVETPAVGYLLLWPRQQKKMLD